MPGLAAIWTFWSTFGWALLAGRLEGVALAGRRCPFGALHAMPSCSYHVIIKNRNYSSKDCPKWFLQQWYHVVLVIHASCAWMRYPARLLNLARFSWVKHGDEQTTAVPVPDVFDAEEVLRELPAEAQQISPGRFGSQVITAPFEPSAKICKGANNANKTLLKLLKCSSGHIDCGLCVFLPLSVSVFCLCCSAEALVGDMSRAEGALRTHLVRQAVNSALSSILVERDSADQNCHELSLCQLFFHWNPLNILHLHTLIPSMLPVAACWWPWKQCRGMEQNMVALQCNVFSSFVIVCDEFFACTERRWSLLMETWSAM